jgi:predicted pyridoxine 5'-phosphate oxidase superfamily flavin-nucleotide-binding protein
MSSFHEGEFHVQERACVRALADKVGRSIHDSIPPSAASFALEQRLAVVATVDSQGWVWASPVVGEPGFLSTENEHTLRVKLPAAADDILLENLRRNHTIGLLVLDPRTRRRMRINGTAEMSSDGHLRVRVSQVYANCPQYIQARVFDSVATEQSVQRTTTAAVLSSAQQEVIRRADTFFLATHHSQSGADASHRGGFPGFVEVMDEQTLVWPDYRGNNLFQSLGNIQVQPRAGLLFLDFEQGDTLQLTGSATIVWNIESLSRFPGAQRLVEYKIDRVRESRAALPQRWRLTEYSPFNPR